MKWLNRIVLIVLVSFAFEPLPVVISSTLAPRAESARTEPNVITPKIESQLIKLIKQMGSPKGKTRLKAIRKFNALPHKQQNWIINEIRGSLLVLLSRPQPDRRISEQFIFAFSSLPDPARNKILDELAEAKLFPRFSSLEMRVILTLVESLGWKVATPSVLDALMSGMQDSNIHTRSIAAAAALSLAALPEIDRSSHPVYDLLGPWARVVRGESLNIPAEIQEILTQLKASDDPAPLASFINLSDQEREQLILALASQLRDPGQSRPAVKALRLFEVVQVPEPFLAFLAVSLTNPQVDHVPITLAVKILCEQHPNSVHGSLFTWPIQHALFKTLQDLFDRISVLEGDLVLVLLQPSWGWTTLQMAVGVIEVIRYDWILSLRNRDSAIRAATLEQILSLGPMDPSVFIPSFSLLDSLILTLREFPLQEIGRMTSRIVEELRPSRNELILAVGTTHYLDQLGSPDIEERIQAAEGFATFSSEVRECILRTLRARLYDPDPTVRLSTFWAIQALGPAPLTQPMMEGLTAGIQNPNEQEAIRREIALWVIQLLVQNVHYSPFVDPPAMNIPPHSGGTFNIHSPLAHALLDFFREKSMELNLPENAVQLLESIVRPTIISPVYIYDGWERDLTQAIEPTGIGEEQLQAVKALQLGTQRLIEALLELPTLGLARDEINFESSAMAYSISPSETLSSIAQLPPELETDQITIFSARVTHVRATGTTVPIQDELIELTELSVSGVLKVITKNPLLQFPHTWLSKISQGTTLEFAKDVRIKLMGVDVTDWPDFPLGNEDTITIVKGSEKLMIELKEPEAVPSPVSDHSLIQSL